MPSVHASPRLRDAHRLVAEGAVNPDGGRRGACKHVLTMSLDEQS
jgi:hypothetical protein